MSKSGFISWSGDEARQVAENLKELFGFVLASPDMFVASRDLKAGDVWFTEIATRLDACDVGVIVVTPQNVSKPWLHFEAGAIAKRVGRSAAIPLLCGMTAGDLAHTALAQLQAITTKAEDVQQLCHRLNELLGLELPAIHIDTAFPVWWEKYKDGIDNPEIWKGTKKAPAEPTMADLSVQLTQLASALADLSDQVKPSAKISNQRFWATLNEERANTEATAALIAKFIERDGSISPETAHHAVNSGLLGATPPPASPPPPPPPPTRRNRSAF